MKGRALLLFVFLWGIVSVNQLHSQQLTLEADLDTLSNVTEINLSAESADELQLSNPIYYLDDQLLIGQVASVTADELGRVYIADSDQNTIHLFEADGDYIESFGRDGEGPGEFRSLVRIDHRDGTIYALDRNLNRITQFDSESLTVENTLGLSGVTNRTGMNRRSMPETFFVLPGERFLITFSMFASGTGQVHFQPVDIMDSDGRYEGADQIKIPVRQSIMRETGGNIGVIVPPYGRKSTLVASESGDIYTNWSEHLLIKQYAENGNYVQSWYSRQQGPPLSRSGLRDRYSEAFMEYIRGETLPDTWPLIRTFIVDDQERLWISLYSSNHDEAEWFVIGSEGSVHSKFTRPSSHTIKKIAGDQIYILEEDGDGFDLLKRYTFSY